MDACHGAVATCFGVLFLTKKFFMSLSVEPAVRSAAAAVISLSVMRRLPVTPLGRKIGTYSFFLLVG